MPLNRDLKKLIDDYTENMPDNEDDEEEVEIEYVEEVEVDDNTTEEELEELALEFFWERFGGSYGYEIIEE